MIATRIVMVYLLMAEKIRFVQLHGATRATGGARRECF
ncbi:hypothetical protein BSLA_01f5387 [Burkholderia stabilis]|nr:hypothetical protein BSLA_01f5387 [Burkholderia stabilis]